MSALLLASHMANKDKAPYRFCLLVTSRLMGKVDKPKNRVQCGKYQIKVYTKDIKE